MTVIIRASSLPGYSDCPRRWASNALSTEIVSAGFNLNKQPPKSVGASVGTATHGGAAFLLTEKMKSGELGNQTEAEQRALEEFKESSVEGVLMDEVTPNMNDAEKQIVRMVKSYSLHIASRINPLMVEQRLEAKVGGDFVLSGQSDVQCFEPGRIRDLKTGKISRVHYGQLGAYSLLARTSHPEHESREVCTDFIQRVSLKNEQPLPVTEFYDQCVAEQAASATIDRIKQDVDEFRKRISDDHAAPEHAFLANPNSMLCNAKFCPAHGSGFCREHRK